jgi:hypothetical protein
MSLFSQLLKIFDHSPSSRRATAKRSSVRLGIESLEDRLVPSASSISVHAITPATGGSVAYFINPIDKTFDEKINYAGYSFIQQVAPAGAVSDLSAGLTNTGTAVVFAHYNGVLKYFSDPTGWQNTNAPIGMLNFAAVDGGRLYATGSNHALWEYTIPYQVTTRIVNPRTPYQVSWITTTVGGWSELSAANAVWKVDAVTEPHLATAVTPSSGRDVVFASGFTTQYNSGNNRLIEYSQGTWTYIAGNGIGYLYTFSAGLDSQGKAEVWFQLYNDGFGNNYTFGSWTAAAGYHSYGDYDHSFVYATGSFSATGDGQFYAFYPDADALYPGAGSLALFDPQDPHGPFVVVGLDNNTQISAAGPGDVYYIQNGYLGELTNGNILSWQL